MGSSINASLRNGAVADTRRPGESQDPYRGFCERGTLVDAVLRDNIRLWLWVLAFARTTRLRADIAPE